MNAQRKTAKDAHHGVPAFPAHLREHRGELWEQLALPLVEEALNKTTEPARPGAFTNSHGLEVSDSDIPF